MKIQIKTDDSWRTISFPENEQQPGIINNTPMIPINVVLRELGFHDTWIPAVPNVSPGTLHLVNGKDTIYIFDGKSYFDVTTRCADGKQDCIRYDHADGTAIRSRLVGGRLLVPIHGVLESIRYNAFFDTPTQTVKIIPPSEDKIYIKYNYNYMKSKSSDKPYFGIVSQGEAVTLPRPSRTGFVFDGWYIGRTNGTRVGNENNEYTPTESITLYAYWGTKYNITLVTNGGNVESTLISVDIGQSVQLPTPDREGYKFEGWFLNSDFQGEPVNAEDYHPIDHVTLYAKWKSDGSKITLPYIINQKYSFSYNGQSINLESKCAGVCAMDISMYYRDVIFRGTEAEIISQLTKEIWDMYYGKDSDGSTPYMFNGNRVLWGNVSGVNFDTEHKDDDISDFSTIFDLAVKSIVSGNPMMIHYRDLTNKDNEHWVIPVSYSSEGMSIKSLTVADPSTRDSSYVTNTWTLEDSIGYNFSMGNNVDTTNIRYGYVTTLPAATN